MCSYHPRFETSEAASFQTTRCRNSELWFAANHKLETSILAKAARCAERYDATLYALAIEGNHIQVPARFPKLNRARFMRDFNSAVARAVPKFVKTYPGGRLWQRRYSSEIVPFEDLERLFFYTVLQPVQDGLVEKLSDYPFYNCFHDAVWGIRRKFKVVRWAEYHEARKNGVQVALSDFTDEVYLEYARLPGYEGLSQKEYAQLMIEKLEERRRAIVQARYADGKGFLGRQALLKMQPGSLPKSTKVSNRDSHRPRVLSDCAVRRRFWLGWYFDRFFYYREVSALYRAGAFHIKFPEGSYRPPVLTAAPAG